MMPQRRRPRAGKEVGGLRLQVLGDILLVVGGLILSYPLWSAGYAHIQQARLDASYQERSDSFVFEARRVDGRAHALPDAELVRRRAVAYRRGLEKGDTIGRMSIPSLALDRIVQQGATGPAALDADGDRSLLRKGLVHYAVTPLPGEGEPFAVAGHRTTYGAPFGRLDRLQRGAVILVETPYALFRYTVAKKTVVEPTDAGVLLDRGYGLVLTTCTPPHSASHRLIVWAVLESVKPAGGEARPAAP